MSSPATFNRFLKLLEKWPVDKNKIGKDLGEHLRNYYKTVLLEGKVERSEEYWDRQYLSLQRLLSNEHKRKYNTSRSYSATGLSAKECNEILTDEVLNLYNEEVSTSIWKKLFKRKKYQ